MSATNGDATAQNSDKNETSPTVRWIKKMWRRFSLTDLVVLALMTLLGLALPKFVLDEQKAWKHYNIPGQVVNLTFIDNTTNIEYETEVFLKDPDYSKVHTADEVETVDTNLLFFFAGAMPLFYIPVFLIILQKLSNKYSKTKNFLDTWELLWFEYISFMYTFAIAMSITFWSVKTMKILVSQPRPDFYDRCDLDISDPHNPECMSEAEDEILKSFRSFPSGHSSNMFTSGICLTLYTWNKLNIMEPMKMNLFEHVWYYRPFVDFFLLWPVMLAGWAASTRIHDHLHTATDILGGACIGFVAAWVGYHSQYKRGSPWSYRLLMRPEIQMQIRRNATLHKIMYPMMYKDETNSLLMKMTRYKEESRHRKQREGEMQSDDNEMHPSTNGGTLDGDGDAMDGRTTTLGKPAAGTASAGVSVKKERKNADESEMASMRQAHDGNDEQNIARYESERSKEVGVSS